CGGCCAGHATGRTNPRAPGAALWPARPSGQLWPPRRRTRGPPLAATDLDARPLPWLDAARSDSLRAHRIPSRRITFRAIVALGLFGMYWHKSVRDVLALTR